MTLQNKYFDRMTSSRPPSSVIALLDLPQGSVLTIDGKPIVLQKSDFVGFDQLPAESKFHFITVRATSPSKDDTSQREYSSPVITGLIVIASPNNTDPVTIVRRFDPLSSELSSNRVDEATESNLLENIQQGRVDGQRLVSYHRVLSTADEESWRNRTKFVTARLLRKRGLHNGDKIIPGTYEADEVSLKATLETVCSTGTSIVDGKAVVYPPIPVLDKARDVRHVSHAGTKAYLAQLPPSHRTSLFTNSAPTSRLKDVLERYYDLDWKELLGDLQLSYQLFLCLHCLSSFEHWRDLVALLSSGNNEHVMRYHDLYENFLLVLASHVQTMESDFFEDVELSGDNFLVPSIHRLCHACLRTNDATIISALQPLAQIVSRKIPNALEADIGTELETSSRLICVDFCVPMDEDLNAYRMTRGDDEDDEDGPVVVAEAEMAAFAARSAELKTYLPHMPQLQYPQNLRGAYPLLFAARMPQEDILMTCARALDDASDVSLVREAADYLENVENKLLS